jgi:hypothetical protein
LFDELSFAEECVRSSLVEENIDIDPQKDVLPLPKRWPINWAYIKSLYSFPPKRSPKKMPRKKESKQ